MSDIFDKYLARIEKVDTIHFTGSVIGVKGMLIESNGPQSIIGEICTIHITSTNSTILAEVVGLNEKIVQLMAYGETTGIEVGCAVVSTGNVLEIGVGSELLGRVLDATGKSYDKKPDIITNTYYPAVASPPEPLDRKPIEERIVTGIRAIDAFLSVGKGQRMGVFAGSGVGKSTLLGMIARNTNADVNVIALIGERGREVIDFIKRDLGEEGLKRSVVIAATSDQSPLSRLRGAYTATAVAEYFRDQGKDVMLMFDSVTRFARAQREIGLSIGEPPAQRGYTPSVFETLPKLLERSGTSNKGTITGFYTVLVDGDDMDEPISDTVRGILDGHIVLSRSLAQSYHFPAIDVLASISRLANRVTGTKTKEAVAMIRKLMAAYADSEDMITVGAYQKGSNVVIDTAIDANPLINSFLVQDEFEHTTLEDTIKGLSVLTNVEIPDDEWKEKERDDAFNTFHTARILDDDDIESALQNKSGGIDVNNEDLNLDEDLDSLGE